MVEARPRCPLRTVLLLGLLVVLAACAAAAPSPPPDARSEPSTVDPPDDPAPAATPSDGPVDGMLEVHYLDVGQGDATLLLHDEVAVLIDAGRWQASDLVPMLTARGVEALDLVVITHPHADHIGQFDRVLDAFDVEEVWWSGSETTSQTFERSLDALERSGAFYEEPRAGDTTTIGPLLVEVVNPSPGAALTDLHNAGLAMRITYGEVRLLFTGDAERLAEARMVSQAGATLAADILQLGHHGSETSTTPGFLDAVGPSVAIYSASAGNPFGHPDTTVLDRLTRAGVEVYGTDVHGSVTVTTDGIDWTVGTEHDGDVMARGRGAVDTIVEGVADVG